MHASTGSRKSRGLVAVVAAWVALVVILVYATSSTEACNAAAGSECTSPAAVTTPTASPSDTPATAPPGSSTAPTPSASLAPTPAPTPTPQAFVFDDEFSGTTLAPHWGRHWPGFGRADWSSDQLSVGNGVLTITARRTGTQFVSGLIDTVDTFEHRYGTYSARIRFTEGDGLWPAFWLAQPQNPAHELGEVDIMEVCANRPGEHGGKDVTLLNSYVHRADSSSAYASRHRTFNLSGAWHEYTLEWRREFMAFSLDGMEYARFTDASEIPSIRMAIVLDYAGGGAYCGDANSTTPLNATMEIDWVRVTE